MECYLESHWTPPAVMLSPKNCLTIVTVYELNVVALTDSQLLILPLTVAATDETIRIHLLLVVISQTIMKLVIIALKAKDLAKGMILAECSYFGVLIVVSVVFLGKIVWFAMAMTKKGGRVVEDSY